MFPGIVLWIWCLNTEGEGMLYKLMLLGLALLFKSVTFQRKSVFESKYIYISAFLGVSV